MSKKYEMKYSSMWVDFDKELTKKQVAQVLRLFADKIEKGHTIYKDKESEAHYYLFHETKEQRSIDISADNVKEAVVDHITKLWNEHTEFEMDNGTLRLMQDEPGQPYYLDDYILSQSVGRFCRRNNTAEILYSLKFDDSFKNALDGLVYEIAKNTTPEE